MDYTNAWQLAAAIGMGLLIGLERERTQGGTRRFAGVRTFSLIALLGATSVLTTQFSRQEWLIGLIFLAVVAFTLISYQVSARKGKIGITTEISVLLTFTIGCLCAWGEISVAGAITATTMLILALKEWLHTLAKRIEPDDLRATIKFAIITLIILPILPDRYFGPEGMEVINPYKTWLMVVLIAGLNFVGYVLVKIVGKEHGLVITGLLGGLVSSTALTLSFAQRSRQQPELSQLLSLSILLAWTIMFIRVLIVVAVVRLSLLQEIFLPILYLIGLSLIICLTLWVRHSAAEKAEVETRTNPFELGPAIKFSLLFAVMLLITHAAQQYYGDAGTYLIGAIAGLTDVDAITLSMVNLAGEQVAFKTAACTILIAALANTFMKSMLCVWFGAPAMRRIMIPIIFVFTLAATLIFVFLDF